MGKYVNVPVPFRLHGNRQYLADEQLTEIPELADFVSRFPRCFERDEFYQVWWFWLEGDAPNPSSPLQG